MQYDGFKVTTDDAGVSELVFNNDAKRNCMSKQFWHDLPAAVNALSKTGKTRVLIVHSEGKHFTSGMDLNNFMSLSSEGVNPEKGRFGDHFMHTVALLQHTFSSLEKARFPVIAAVQGGCFGAGIDMICAADMRYCTEDAFFVVQETNIGMSADVGTLQRIQHCMPSGLARELCYTGRNLSAAEAGECGFANQVFHNQQAMLEHVRSVAEAIAQKSPMSVYGCKHNLNYSRDHSVDESLQYQSVWQAGHFHMDDMAEAMGAKFEGRAAKFANLNSVEDLFK